MKKDRMPKSEFAAMKRAEVKAMQGKLDAFLKEALGSKSAIKELTDHYRISGLYNYSFYNSLLIKMQGGSIAQSYNKWKKLGRNVVKGTKAYINIFRPMFKKEKLIDGTEESKLVGFKLVSVFNIDQTEGKPLEYDHNSSDELDIPYERICAVLESLTDAKVVEKLTGNARGYSDGNELVVSSMSNDTDKAKTAIHEAVHHLLHTGKAAEKKVPYATAEVEAESTTYLVLSYLGMDFELSKAYVANWKAGVADARTDLIIRTSDKIIKGLKAVMSDEEQFMVALS